MQYLLFYVHKSELCSGPVADQRSEPPGTQERPRPSDPTATDSSWTDTYSGE